jgi:hypothetical protein
MGKEAVAITRQDILWNVYERRETCLRDYDRLYGVVVRLRLAMRTAEDQQERIAVGRQHALHDAESHLAALGKVLRDLETEWRSLLTKDAVEE